MIELAGRVFRRYGESWLIEPTVGRYPVVFDGTHDTTFEFRVIAEALAEIERLTPENVEEPSIPKIGVRHPDERWPDTNGEAIPMHDCTPENVDSPTPGGAQ